MSLILTPLRHIPLIHSGDDLAAILLEGLNTTPDPCDPSQPLTLRPGDILAITSKIVSKAEGRLVNLATITPSEAAQALARRADKDPRLVELILRESREVLRVRPGVIIVEHRLGFICANAGIDHSNVWPQAESPEATPPSEDHVLLLPSDPDASCRALRERIEAQTGLSIGVIMIDSHGRAWRIGTVGTCIGLSGIPAVIDERGWKDLFGRKLRVTIVGVADELAAAASLVMGQAAEGTPVVHVRGFPYPLREGTLSELLRPKELDLFR